MTVSNLEVKVDELTRKIDNMNETLLHMCHLLSQTISSSSETNKVAVTDAEGTMSSSSETNKTTATNAEGMEEDESKNRSSSSKKAQKKQRKADSAAAAAYLASTKLEIDPLSRNYGDVPFHELQSKEVTERKWTEIGSLDKDSKDKEVLIRGRVQTIRSMSNKIAFLVLRQQGFTVQCVVNVAPELVSKQMVKYASCLNKESIVDVYGIVSPNEDIKAATQKVEVQVRKIYCISRAIEKLPINFEDLIRSEAEIEAAALEGKQLARVNRDTRLDYRVLDLRTPANQAIFRIQCQVENSFRSFLLSKGFVGMRTPKMLAGSSEGGSAVFKFNYCKGQPACLAQSPQLHKQIAICGDFNRVFEVGHVFRAEDSYTHRHLCEFTGLDVEMEINEHYSEVMKVVDELFVAIFDDLNKNCKRELEAVRKQFPFAPLKYREETLKLTYEEGIQMLQKAGVKIEPTDDLNTEAEKILGQLVLEEYGTEFYILHRYPLKVRPFYTMPCYDDPTYSNSFDVFIRGEEIISGAQRIHDPEVLRTRAEACGIDVGTISTYIDSFKYGAPLHGGFGACRYALLWSPEYSKLLTIPS